MPSTPTPTLPYPTLPAIAQLRCLGKRFVAWRVRGGKKEPVDGGRKLIDITKPENWRSFDQACCVARAIRSYRIGFVFNGDGYAGADLDACGDQMTGAVDPWAREIVDACKSYTEWSPSGTGLKIFFRVAEWQPLQGNRLCMGEAADGGKTPAIEVYGDKRYFALTGQHLEGSRRKIRELPAAVWAELTDRLAATAPERPEGHNADDPPPASSPELQTRLDALLKRDRKLGSCWQTGEKLTKGGDTSGSGKDNALVFWLAVTRGVDDALIAHALRQYRHGSDTKDERQIARLLANAADMRAKASEKAARKAAATEVPSDWRGELRRNERDLIIGDLANAALALRIAPEMEGRFRFNTFIGEVEYRDGETWRKWLEIDDTKTAEWLQNCGVGVWTATAAESVRLAADSCKVHPLQEWLSGLKWDGERRLDGLLENYFAAITRDENRAYVRAISRKFLISAVARAFVPGCKVDHTLVAINNQGQARSSMVEVLAHDPAWFASDLPPMGTKDAKGDVAGKWIIELAELSSLRRSDVEGVKAFLSQKVDHYRKPYDKRPGDYPRCCVFFGTTNEHEPLKDETGNRRMWVFEGRVCEEPERLRNMAAIQKAVPQLWAEAVAAYRAGEKWWLDEAEETVARSEQDMRRTPHPWQEALAEKLALEDETTAAKALNLLEKPLERQTTQDLKTVASCLRNLGWTRHPGCMFGDRKTTVWRAPTLLPTPKSTVGGAVGGKKPSKPNGINNTSYPPTHEPDDNYICNQNTQNDEKGSCARKNVMGFSEQGESGWEGRRKEEGDTPTPTPGQEEQAEPAIEALAAAPPCPGGVGGEDAMLALFRALDGLPGTALALHLLQATLPGHEGDGAWHQLLFWLKAIELAGGGWQSAGQVVAAWSGAAGGTCEGYEGSVMKLPPSIMACLTPRQGLSQDEARRYNVVRRMVDLAGELGIEVVTMPDPSGAAEDAGDGQDHSQA